MSARGALTTLVVLVLLATAIALTLRSAPAAPEVPVRDSTSSLAPPATLALSGELAPAAGAIAAPAKTSERNDVGSARVALVEATEAVLEVRVVSLATKRPIAGVAVGLFERARSEQDPPAFVSRRVDLGVDGDPDPRTDANGLVSFTVPVGAPFVVRASGIPGAVGESLAAVEACAAGSRTAILLALQTEPQLVFHGRLVAVPDRAPVAGALVAVVEERMFAAPSIEASTTSDADGRFVLRFLEAEPAIARIDAPGFGSARIEVTAEHATEETALEVRVLRAASLRARVVDERGLPLGGRDVLVSIDARELRFRDRLVYAEGANEWSARTGADGRCEFRGLPADAPLQVTITTPEPVASAQTLPTIRLSPGEIRDAELVVADGRTVRGRVLADGAPLAERRVWLSHLGGLWTPSRSKRSGPHEGPRLEEARTDADGRFRFDDVDPGVWSIEVEDAATERLPGPEGGADALRRDPLRLRDGFFGAGFAGTRTFEVAIGREPDEIVLDLGGSLSIRGRVLDPRGVPAAGATVLVTSRAPPRALDAPTSADGEFEIGPLPPGEYRASAVDRRGDHAPSDEVAIEAGARDLVLRLRAGATIGGSVVDAASGASCPADVVLVRAGESSRSALAIDASSGVFAARGIEAGTYDVSATTEDGRCGFLRDVVLAPGESRDALRVEVAPGARLRVVAEGARGSVEYEASSGGRRVAGGVVGAGSSEVAVVPAGTIEVRARGGELVATLALAVGDEPTVRIPARP